MQNFFQLIGDFIGTLPNYGNTILYFLIAIGVLVFIHELGHFLAARSTGMRAEVFALGIGYRLFGFNKKNGFTFGKLPKGLDLEDNTDYRICAFPIGGYVKISGMVDESMDKNFINTPPKPWEYRSKPVWKRMIVITAGVVMNLILAFAVFYGLILSNGKTYRETTTVGYVTKNSVAFNYGIKEGDKILSINQKSVNNWEAITSSIYNENLGESITLDIQRGNENLKITIPKEKTVTFTENVVGIYENFTQPELLAVAPGKPAEMSGMKEGDVIIEFNGEKINNSQKLVELVKENTNKPSEIKWNRKGAVMSANLTPSSDSTIGISFNAKYSGPEKIEKYNVITAVPVAISDMFNIGIKPLAKIVKGEIPFRKAIGGPVKIAQASAKFAEAGFLTFIWFVAILSISLAVINILPFPALDGGHFVILFYEAVVRKPLSYKVQIALQNVGFIILLAFMLFVIYNDIISMK